MASFTTSLPLYVTIGVRKKKNIYFNYNRIIQLHFQQRNQIKRMFMNRVIVALKECLKFEDMARITYVVYRPNRRRYDVMNVVSIIDKFFQDTLVVADKILDDNYTIVPSVKGLHGGISKTHPRVDVLVEGIDKEAYNKELQEVLKHFSEEIGGD